MSQLKLPNSQPKSPTIQPKLESKFNLIEFINKNYFIIIDIMIEKYNKYYKIYLSNVKDDMTKEQKIDELIKVYRLLPIDDRNIIINSIVN